ncbi:MAG: ABC transporter ATP-binding protein [Planctomycetaceae bacterium]
MNDPLSDTGPSIPLRYLRDHSAGEPLRVRWHRATQAGSDEQTMIQVDKVTKTHRRGETEIPVLRGVSCEIPDGAFAYIIGPSGSGKSTLLYLLGALDRPTTGTIRIDGALTGEWSAERQDRFRRHDVGFIFQSFNLLENLTAVDNVLVPEIPRGIPPERRNEAERLLRELGLGDRLDHRPSQLSGGEQQRVAIARALLKRPRLVLADEPTGELDSENGSRIFEDLRRLQADQGATVVVVTHDQRYIRDRDLVLTIRDGVIARD